MKTLLLTFGLFFSFNFYSAVVYISVNGAGTMDGSSWTNAAPGNQLQARINAANFGDQIWVACGTYLTTTTTNRTISFSMRNGIEIYGSFVGIETSINQRNLNCGFCSILSGEIGTAAINDNSYKVVSNANLYNTAILDGFEIRGGNDDRTPTNSGNGLGGGLYNHGLGAGSFCNPTIRNCFFTNNRASWGGGAFNNGYAGGFTQPTYINCIFYENQAYIEAGGMDSYGVGGTASPRLYNCIFDHNTSNTNVGAMYCWGGNANGNSHPVLVNCIFTNNTATNGYGGAFISDNLDENGTTSSGSASVTLINCILWNNTATGVGPQFYIRGNGATVFSRNSCINMTNQTGAHVLTSNSSVTTSDPLFINSLNPQGNDNCWLTADDGLALSANSPSINAGIDSLLQAFDILGENRIFGSSVDQGAYEFIDVSSVLEVNAESIEIFPNPASETLQISNLNTKTPFKILGLDGKVVLSGEVSLDNNELDIHQLEKGQYLLLLENQNKVIKWIKN